jgi:ABC-2 type transport system ATP-binding protein
MSNAISVDLISKSYGDFVAVNEISIEVKTGSIFGLLGPNGAGKSTTIRMIVNITMPDSGQIALFGQPMSAKLQERVGYLPEDRGLYKKMKVGEQLAFFAELKGITRQEAHRRIDAWLKRIEMTEWKNKKWEELSKGMQQKVQFVSTILHSPDLVILDEPFSGLDPIAVETMKELLLEQVGRGVAVLFSSHQLDLVTDICRDVVIVDRGRIVLQGDVHELRGRSPFRDVVVRYESSDEPERLRVPAATTIDDVLAQLSVRGPIVDLSFGPPELSEVFLGAVGRTQAEIEPAVDVARDAS